MLDICLHILILQDNAPARDAAVGKTHLRPALNRSRSKAEIRELFTHQDSSAINTSAKTACKWEQVPHGYHEEKSRQKRQVGRGTWGMGAGLSGIFLQPKTIVRQGKNGV
ncbi:TPA: hypothetical protein DDW35_04465 [Candidatus Sumerlaeota bacterium]|nr:hypothetical protein [Candidatus Sumerlaeota bacterium]